MGVDGLIDYKKGDHLTSQYSSYRYTGFSGLGPFNGFDIRSVFLRVSKE